MDAQQFLAEFGHVANAPGGVARLRELILSLAFKGELCPHSNESSDILLEDIERQRLEFNGETRKQRLTRRSNETKKAVEPYEIPGHWSWASLSTVGHTWGQKKPDDSFVYIDVSSIDNKVGVLSQNPEVVSANAAPSRARKIIKNGTLVYSTVRPYLLNIAIIDRDFEFEPIASTAFAIVHPWQGISTRYLYFYLRSPIFVRYVESVQIGMAYPAISDEKFYSGIVPLPPTEEQSRIVAKVDELMALCNKLETQQQHRRKLQNNLRQSTLQAVATATSPHELQTTWARLADNFGQLFHSPQDLYPFKALILRLAVRGLLVEQSSTDTPATELLKNIDAERQKLISAKRMKVGITLPTIKLDDFPYQLPKGWVWARVIDLVDIGTGATPAKSEPDYYGGDVPWYTSSATNDKFARHPETFITQKALNETNCKVFPVGSLIIALYGQGKTRGQISELKIAGATNQALAAMMFFESSLEVKGYLKYFFEKIYDEIRLQAEGGPQPNLNVGKIKETLIPVPPIEEQSRIVSKLDQFMAQCDQFSVQLRSANTVAERLAIASVASITGIATEQKEEPMKVPQTELIALVRLGQAPDIKAQSPLATLLARHNNEMSAKDLWQRFGGEIDAFYAQLKTEVAHGWIQEPGVAEMREKLSDTVSA